MVLFTGHQSPGSWTYLELTVWFCIYWGILSYLCNITNSSKIHRKFPCNFLCNACYTAHFWACRIYCTSCRRSIAKRTGRQPWRTPIARTWKRNLRQSAVSRQFLWEGHELRNPENIPWIAGNLNLPWKNPERLQLENIWFFFVRLSLFLHLFPKQQGY